MPTPRHGNDSGWGMLLNAANMGLHLVVATFVGLAIGFYLDKWLCSIDGWCTRPWMTIIWLVSGIVAGFRDIFVQAKKIQAAEDEKNAVRRDEQD